MAGRIRSARGAVVIEKEDNLPVEMPVADVAIVLIGQSVSISGAVLHRLLSNDIAVLVCDWKGVPEGGAYSWSEHTRVGARAQAQAELSLPRKKNAWGRIIRAKILGQAAVLKEYRGESASYLERLAKKVKSGDPENCEGQAARYYWQHLWDGESFRRNPGAGVDNRNAHLDYAYTVLRGHGIRAVLSAGLAPALGLFHRGRSNNFALVDDLMEPFRPAVDAYVAELSCDADMENPETRKHLVEASSKPFDSQGYTISSVFVDFAQHFGRYAEGDEQTLTVPVWQGEQ